LGVPSTPGTSLKGIRMLIIDCLHIVVYIPLDRLCGPTKKVERDDNRGGRSSCPGSVQCERLPGCWRRVK
jgi:hypothetical protein